MIEQSLPKISASLLAIKEFPEKFIEQSILAIKAGADLIHLDIVGGKGKSTKIIEENSDDTSSFFTPELLKQIKKRSIDDGLCIPVDIHMMNLEPSESEIGDWITAGADYIVIHWDAFEDEKILGDRLQFIKNNGAKPGLSLRPDVKISDIIKFLEDNPNLVELISQCGVYPCLGGQAIICHIFNNVTKLDELRKARKFSYKIMIDGGIKPGVITQKSIQSGADILVAGSAFFGKGDLKLEQLSNNAQMLKNVGLGILSPDIYMSITQRIRDIRAKKRGKIWVLIEGYHGSGKTFITQRLEERLISLGLEPIVFPLDIFWTDRRKRAQWKSEAYDLRQRGIDHNYFHSINQKPEPMHWREAHSNDAISKIETANGKAIIDNCYRFNEVGDTEGRLITHITDDSIILVEGVYASLLDRKDWDLRIYISCDKEVSKKRAMVRDEIKVYRPQEETRALYEDVYEDSYEQYLKMCNPIEKANIIIDATSVNKEMMPIDRRIIKAKPFFILLECVNPDCQHQYSSTRIEKCELCGSDLAETIIGEVNFIDSIIKKEDSMWRYRNLVLVKPEFVVSDQEGNTPIVYMRQISKKLGIHLWLKLEIVNPTGTFKDREASYVISLSRQYGQENVVMQSTGNTAISITHYAGLAGIPSWCFIPESSCYKLLMPPKKSKNRIIAVKGHPIDVKNLAESFAKHFGFPKISPFYERCEANAMLGYETGEALLEGKLPEYNLLGKGGFDYYVQTISAGMGAIGFFYGMKRLQQWTKEGIMFPRILGVEISEFAPIHYAWEQGLEQVGEDVATPYFPDHPLFEPTLWTTNIRKYYPHLVKMVKESGGMLAVVEPKEVKETIDKYEIIKELESMGYRLSNTENSSFIGFTGLVKKIVSGEIPKQSNVILMLTGKGYHNNFIQEKPDFIADPKVNGAQDIMDGIPE